jgi:hypothetical protein
MKWGVRRAMNREYARANDREGQLRAIAKGHIDNMEYNKAHGYDTSVDDIRLRMTRNDMERLQNYKRVLEENLNSKEIAKGHSKIQSLLVQSPNWREKRNEDSAAVRKLLAKDLEKFEDFYDQMNDPDFEKPTTEAEKDFWRNYKSR